MVMFQLFQAKKQNIGVVFAPINTKLISSELYCMTVPDECVVQVIIQSSSTHELHDEPFKCNPHPSAHWFCTLSYVSSCESSVLTHIVQ